MQNENARLRASEVVARLPEDVRMRAEIVGAWVWVAFPGNPGGETVGILKGLGLRFNAKRKVWQHCGGRPVTAAHPGDPKLKYGVIRVSEVEGMGVAA